MLMHEYGGWGRADHVITDTNKFFLQISGFLLIFINVNNF